MNQESVETPKKNWPLILGSAAVVLVGVLFVLGVLLMWANNFNLLTWTE